MRPNYHPTQGMRVDNEGVVRFRQNRIVRVLLDTSKLDLNDIAGMGFPIEDRVQLAQLIGYSLGGFAELPYVTDAVYRRAVKEADKAKQRHRRKK